MRTPLRPIPEDVSRWVRRAGRLRWLDGAVAWLGVWAGTMLVWPATERAPLGVLAAVMLAGPALVPSLRRRWRPVSAVAAVVLSWRLRPGDRAWHVRPDGARLVLVTSGRWRHVVVAGVVQDSGEGMALPRTRALLVPAGRVRR
jgi:threonine/homoserine efflux transporter RhtA